MKNTIAKISIALVVIALFVGGYFAYQNYFKGEEGSKGIIITIEDASNKKVLVKEEEFRTDAANLGDFLEEKKEELGVTMDDSEFGRFLVGLKDLKTEDMSKGPWWMYSYDSDKKDIHLEVGKAPGVDELGLNDGDKIKFVFTNEMTE